MTTHDTPPTIQLATHFAENALAYNYSLLMNLCVEDKMAHILPLCVTALLGAAFRAKLNDLCQKRLHFDRKLFRFDRIVLPLS